MNVLGLTAICIVLVYSVEAQVNSICNSNDSMALKAFMNGLEIGINGWTSNSSNCCDWDGVTCDFNGKVVKLELSKTKLMGELAVSFTNLDQLKTLNLSDNLLGGTLPISIFHLPRLELLDLSKNEFSGSLPVSVNLPSIQLLDISDNNFKGPIASGLCINSTRIRVLNLGINYFDGEIPLEFDNCSSLEQLYLHENEVTGIIPEYLYRLPRLIHLSLQGNNLISPLRASIPSNLVHLDVSLNKLSGNLPDIFHMFPNLSYFAAQSSILSGEQPPSLINSRTIYFLIIRNNSFVGPINLNCSAMINLVTLNLAGNHLQGSIPYNLLSCPKLKNVDFGGNNLVGKIPESFKRFDSLSYLCLSWCKLKNLSYSLKILQHCQNLTTLVLNKSFDDEEMPSVGKLLFKKLQTLVLSNCKLTGNIPLWLNGLSKLRILDLSFNPLSGEIPSLLGVFPSLFYLDLSNNLLNGSIQKSLTRLPGLQFQDISLEVSLDMPIFIRKGMIGKVLKYTFGDHFPSTLDLSNNSLTGPIWAEFGNLKSLHILNLKYNKLSGNIPSSLGELSIVETLDLSHNHLSGEIPYSLGKLSKLSKFSVAYNNLTGIIPSGGQFSTFLNSSFEGNTGLCGKFVLTCRKAEDQHQMQTPEDKEDFFIGLPLWTGFGIGYLISVVVLLVVPIIRDS